MLGKIYKIESESGNCCYIGSTNNSLKIRFNEHMSSYKNGHKNRCSSADVLKFDDAKISLIKFVLHLKNSDLRREEGKYIRETKNCVNKAIAGRTIKEYYQDNFEAIAKDKGTVCECECGGNYTRSHKMRHMESTKHKKGINKFVEMLATDGLNDDDNDNGCILNVEQYFKHAVKI